MTKLGRLVVFWASVMAVSSLLLPQSQGNVKVGYARITGAEAGATPAGTALFTFSDQDGVLLSQAGVAAVEPVPEGRVFVDQAGTRTAVAVVNTGEASTLNFTLRNADGEIVGEESEDFIEGEHRALFVDELFRGVLAEGFVGSLTFQGSSGSAQWAAVTLRQSLNAAGLPIFATLPVLPLAGEPGDQRVVFPQVGAGGGLLSTQLILINPESRQASGQIELFTSAGEPLVLELDGTSGSLFDYSIAPDGVLRSELTRSQGQGVGYAVVTPTSGALPSGSAIFQFRSGESLISEAGVGAAPVGGLFRMFVDNAGTRTGVALATAGNPQTRVTFRLLDSSNRVIESVERTLPAAGHISIFADELFPDLLSGFTGILELESDQPIAPVTLKLTANARNEPILTTLPVVDLENLSATSELVFPQVGFGFAGNLEFSTRLILINGRLETALSGDLAFFEAKRDGSGNTVVDPLIIPLGGAETNQIDFDLDEGEARQFYPGVIAGLAQILVDSADLVVNQGSTVPLRPITLDEAGNPRDDFQLNYQSLNPETVQVDSKGNMTALNRGFSTLVISSGDILARFTVTSGTVTSSVPGFEPTDVAQDFGGQLYLANSSQHTVLFSESLGDLPEVWAGVEDESGLKDAERLRALFSGPTFLALNQGAGGELFVSDGANHAIRTVEPGAAGEVSTFAGDGQPGNRDGERSSARFNQPAGIDLDDRGFLWVADSGSHVIRRINLQTGEVATVAGLAGSAGFADGNGSQARFHQPRGLVFESETLVQQLVREQTGDPPPPASVLVADSGNGRIRRVWEDGRVETLGNGNLQASRSAPGGISLQQSGTPYRFSRPQGLAVDPFGTVYVSERDSGKVKAILRNGESTLAAERGSFLSPGGMTITVRGRILVAESRRSVQQIRYAGPAIASLEPTEVSALGGDRVRLEGSNIAPESIVVVGGVLVTQVDFIDTNTIEFTLPPLPSGSQTLTIQHRGGLAQAELEIVPPSIAETTAGDITTIVGGTRFAGDGRAAAQATLRGPAGIVVAAGGEIFIADRDQHRVRRVDPVTGLISTVAGTGIAGSSSRDGLPGVLTQVSAPSAVALDEEGNLLIADSRNHLILKWIAESGVVETVAGTGVPGFSGDGGQALDARFRSPSGILVDPEGQIWISDTGNHRLRLIDPATGLVRTVAGTGGEGFSGDAGPADQAQLSSPAGLTWLRDVGVLVADKGNHRIRAVWTDGTIDTWAGIGQAGFGGDGSFPEGALINSPSDVLADSEGNVWIADSGNHRIRQVRALDGVIVTLAGTGIDGFSGDGDSPENASFSRPGGLALEASGALLVADSGNNRVRRIAGDGELVTTVAGSASVDDSGQLARQAALFDPVGVDVGAEALLISEAGAHRIRLVAGPAGGTEDWKSPQAVIALLAGTGTAGDSGDDGPAVDAQLNAPAGLAVFWSVPATGATAGVIFADSENHRVRRVTADGDLFTAAGTGEAGLGGDDFPAPDSPLNRPMDVAFEEDGSVFYFSDTENHRIRRVDATGFVFTVAGIGGQRGFGGDGGPASQAVLNSPLGLVIAPDGRIFFCDSENHRVRVIDRQSGIIETVVGTGVAGSAGDGGPAPSAQLNRPAGLDLDGDWLVIADTGNHRVRAVNLASGIIRTVAGTGTPGFSGDGGKAIEARLKSPWSVRVEPEGDLVIVDRGNGRIRLVRQAVQ